MPASSEPPLTLQDFDAVDWSSVLADPADAGLLTYANRFYQTANDANARGDSRLAAALSLLAHVCSFRLQLDEPRQPFLPYDASSTFRSATPDDIPLEQVEVLRALLPTIDNVLLRARIADFVWVRAHGHLTAGHAVTAYLELSTADVDGLVSQQLRNLERALQLARQLGPETNPYSEATEFIERMLSERRFTEDGFLTKDLLVLALKYELGDRDKHHACAVEQAERAEVTGDWFRAEQYWLVAEDAAMAGSNDERRREALRRISETYVARARESVERSPLGKLLAVTHLQHAIEALRRAGGMRERVDELHVLMMEFQRDIPALLPTFSYKIPIGDFVRAAEEAVESKTLNQALIVFALHPALPKYSDLMEKVEEDASKYRFKSLFPGVQLTREGKVVASQGPTNVSDPRRRDAALRLMQSNVQCSTTILSARLRSSPPASAY
jgi:hypothetical protein